MEVTRSIIYRSGSHSNLVTNNSPEVGQFTVQCAFSLQVSLEMVELAVCRQLPTPGEAVSGESRPQESNQLIPRSDSLSTAEIFWNSDTGKEEKKKTHSF